MKTLLGADMRTAAEKQDGELHSAFSYAHIASYDYAPFLCFSVFQFFSTTHLYRT